MRISENRYFRDLRPLLLASRMLELGARTRTICVWTGLTRDRVRKLAGSTLPGDGKEVRVRHRGRSPQQIAYFFRSPHLWQRASTLASGLALIGLVPPAGESIPARVFPSVARGELLCESYEYYYAAFKEVPIDFERAILLATALAQRDEVELGRCDGCSGLILVDRLAQRTRPSRLCEGCRAPDTDRGTSVNGHELGTCNPEQMRLFDGEDGSECGISSMSTACPAPTDAEVSQPESDSTAFVPPGNDATSIPQVAAADEDSE
jgi:hypothetical protein